MYAIGDRVYQRGCNSPLRDRESYNHVGTSIHGKSIPILVYTYTHDPDESDEEYRTSTARDLGVPSHSKASSSSGNSVATIGFHSQGNVGNSELRTSQLQLNR